MSTPLRDLIDLPAHVRQGDFVLRLSEGITKPEETIRSYVVTPQLVGCFDDALDLIRAATQGGSSKGAYLHGSFGSGKSHFMAVLLLLLEGHPLARAISELAGSVAKLSGWTEGKRFLLVPYHMIGARDLTSAILGGYVDHVLKHRPDAPIPGVYRAESIFSNARSLREAMGDAAFFSRLNGEHGSSTGVLTASDDGWGNLGGGWDAASFAAATQAGPKDVRRSQLVGDIVERLLPAARGASEFVELDEGLSIISRHARGMGYSGLILFLDELILWLSSHAADIPFINQEGQKLAKLVEAQSADRPTPIISFIARQRDLRELVGDAMLGVEHVALSESLSHGDQRFAIIRLDDRNLPTIAERRVLKPKSESAKQQIDQAFRETEKIRKEVLDVLLTSQATRMDFRAIYPFSPALMETLIALSSLLQRERTALKIMFQLLVEQRNTLQLGEIVPVGDLFDVIMRGEEPFSDAMKVHAENAKKLYQQKLLPLIEHDCGISKEEAGKLPPSDSRISALRRDDRLAKTLLLSALAPEVESFRGMTVNKLAALNHGSIRTPVAGREGQIVLERVRRWAGEIGQIKLGDETVNPSVTVQLTGVDTESILAQAASEDNSGNRVRKIKQLVFERLGIVAGDRLLLEHAFLWRGTKRICEVLFTNVRELNDEAFKNPGDQWRLIIDYPFDPDSNHTPRSDLSQVERFRARNSTPARTIVWAPSFFNHAGLRDLGRLVVLDHVLTGTRFDGYATRLSAIDKAQARTILENQCSTLKVRIGEYLEHAYGVRPGGGGILDTTHQLDIEEHLQSLHPDVSIRPPAAANLPQALTAVLSQALAGQFPGHPEFDVETKLSPAVVMRTWGELQKALAAPDGRTMVEAGLRREVKPIVTGLRLAQMSEAHLVVDDYWRMHFERKIAQNSGGAPSVASLRSWLDDPRAMGLQPNLQNLILMFFAAQTNRAWFAFGNPITPTLEELRNDAELREQVLPDASVWSTAVKRANGVFGWTPSALCSAENVAKLNADLKAQAETMLDGVRAVARELASRLSAVAVAPDSSARWKTTQSGLAVLEAMRTASDKDRVAAFARVQLDGTEVAIGTALKQSDSVTRALRDTQWVLLETAAKLSDQRGAAGQALWGRTQDALRHDELAQPLSTALRKIIEDAARLLADSPSTPTPVAVPAVSVTTSPPISGVAPPDSGNRVAIQASHRPIPWGGSDDPDVRAFYANNEEGYARNRRLVQELKQLYRRSQIDVDVLPDGLPELRLLEVIEVHHITLLSRGGPDERSNMIVVTPTLHALIHADPQCRIDLTKGTMTLFGRDFKISVHARHNG